jgi:amino acid transporter
LSKPEVSVGPGEPSAPPPRLARVLGLGDLVLYGVVVIQPVAPMSPFGAIQVESRGHAATAILLAMVAMLLTAASYGRMARAHPSAGSAFTYVGREIHPLLGMVTGWSMVMDYLLNPIICSVWCAQALAGATGVPSVVWVVALAALFTAVNLRGIEASARVNAALAAGMGVVIAAFLIAAARAVFFVHGAPGAAALARPFYDPARWQGGALLTGTSLAVLTYIGFDGISTLAEEARDPRRDILRATVLACLVIGVLATVEVYAAQLLWPAAEPFPQLETAFAHVARRAGGPVLYAAILITLTVANAGSGIGAQLGAARLLYGMGRGGALPARFFGAVDPRRRIPRNNVLLVGAVTAVGALVLEATGGYELGAHLLNFGALVAFMGVNLAAFVRGFVRERRRTVGAAVAPLAGFAVCALLFVGLKPAAKIAGAVWLAAGVALAMWRGTKQLAPAPDR